jgi:hypothetical protein
MGSQSSKVASKAAGAAGRRQYPSTSSILNTAKSTANAPSVSNPPPSSAQVHPSPQSEPPSTSRSEYIDLDARDPHFGSALQRAGVARRVPQHSASAQATFPTSSMPPAGQQAPGQQIFPSNSPSTNPAIAIVYARERIAKRFEQESESLGRGSFQGRTLLSAKDIKDALRLRDEGGQSDGEVEKQMRLQSGILSKLGPRGVVGNA